MLEFSHLACRAFQIEHILISACSLQFSENCMFVCPVVHIHNCQQKATIISDPYLRNGERAACGYRVIYARGGLLSTKEALESHEAIAECDSSFLSA